MEEKGDPNSFYVPYIDFDAKKNIDKFKQGLGTQMQ